jgi:RNA polymerase sigma-70 factor (sigma-E family)
VRGDIEFGEVYRSQRDRLARIAFLICHSREEADDAVAEAVARTWRRWRRGGIDDLAAYLRRAVVNELMTVLRVRRRETALRGSGSFDAAASDVADTVVAEDAMWRALAVLPIRQRAVLVLRYFEDLTEAQAAAVLGLRVGTVKSRAARGLVRLRGLLEDTDVEV